MNRGADVAHARSVPRRDSSRRLENSAGQYSSPRCHERGYDAAPSNWAPIQTQLFTNPANRFSGSYFFRSVSNFADAAADKYGPLFCGMFSSFI